MKAEQWAAWTAAETVACLVVRMAEMEQSWAGRRVAPMAERMAGPRVAQLDRLTAGCLEQMTADLMVDAMVGP